MFNNTVTHLKITLLYLKTTEDKSINIAKNKIKNCF